jgi:hypothetical protein
MLDELIRFAEELYKKDKVAGTELGKIIQDIGKQVLLHNALVKEMKATIKKLESEKKRRMH